MEDIERMGKDVRKYFEHFIFGMIWNLIYKKGN